MYRAQQGIEKVFIDDAFKCVILEDQSSQFCGVYMQQMEQVKEKSKNKLVK